MGAWGGKLVFNNSKIPHSLSCLPMMKLLSQVLCQFRSTQSIAIYFLRCSMYSSFLRPKELTAGAEALLHPQGPWSRPQQPKLLATPNWGSSLHSWSSRLRDRHHWSGMCCWKHSLPMISQHTSVNLCPWPLPQQGWHVGGVNTPAWRRSENPAQQRRPLQKHLNLPLSWPCVQTS